MRTVEVATRDGTCPVYLHTPATEHCAATGEGPWPGVLMFMDGPGMRPAVHALAQRLADAGYAVLLPDFFYRSGAYAPIDPRIVFSDMALRESHRQRFMTLATPDRVMSDTAAILAFAETMADVATGPLGVVGYCMGGRLALIAAGTYPDRFAAAASYHGGGLANDTPSSPHLLAPRMTAMIYVAGAIDDANFDDAQKRRLVDALADAGVDHRVETYPAKHGWVPRDMPVHDAEQAEHHWQTLIPLMDAALKGA